MANHGAGEQLNTMRPQDMPGPSSECKNDTNTKPDDAEGVGSIEVDNSRSVLVKIASLYAEQLMSDINLVVGGVSYPAHRLILCATSEVFQVMLMNREWSEWCESAIELKETQQCAEVFPNFLRYFYTGQIRISHKTVLPVLSLADKYNVKDLVPLCVCYMLRHMAHAVVLGHLVEWLQYTMACGHYEVAKACQNFIKWNLETIADTSNFGNLEPDILISLLDQNDLVVHNEVILYQFVVRWLEHQRSRLVSMEGVSPAEAEEHMRQLVVATMAHVRFPMMRPAKLAQLLLSPLVQKYKDFFVDRMAIAMSFHEGHTELINKIHSTEEGKLLFTPRLYTEDRWSSMLTIDNFHNLQCYNMRTFVFSSHSALAECSGDKACEWVIDLYPKGVWFKKALLICWQGSHEVPEVVLRTVRLALTCRDPPAPKLSPLSYGEMEYDEPFMRVKIGILITGVQWGIEHVMTVKERIFHFSMSQKVLNIDNVLDFDELNTPIYSPPHSGSSQQNASGCSSRYTPEGARKCCQCSKATVDCGKCPSHSAACIPDPPMNLVGPNRDQLKIQVVIVPLADVSCMTHSEFGFK